MLKTYIPPSCPMHMFVRHYMKIKFDRDSAECAEEKKTRLVSTLTCSLVPNLLLQDLWDYL
jgi:hypothetical protein